jgi:hypothetical protein
MMAEILRLPVPCESTVEMTVPGPVSEAKAALTPGRRFQTLLRPRRRQHPALRLAVPS